MTRLRSAAQRAPQTKDQALALLARFSACATAIGERQARRASVIARVNAIVDADVVPLAAELKDIVKQLKPWWAANVQELTGGKRKSIELGGCLLGYRVNPPKVTFTGGDDDVAIAALVEAELAADLVRTKLSLDKDAILAVLKGDAPDPLKDIGFVVSQTEQFFVDLATSKPAPVAQVDDAGAEAVR